MKLRKPKLTGLGVHTAIWGLVILGLAMLYTGKADDTTLGFLIAAIAGVGGYHISKDFEK